MRYFEAFEDMDLSLSRYNTDFLCQALVCIYSTQICKSRSNIYSFILWRKISKYYHNSTVWYSNRNIERDYY